MAGEQSDFQDKLFIISSIYVHLNNFGMMSLHSLMAAVPNGITETVNFMASKLDHVIRELVLECALFLR